MTRPKREFAWADYVEKRQARLGINDEELSHLIGYSPSHLKNMKENTEMPGTRLLHRLGVALNIPPRRWKRSRIQTLMIRKNVGFADLRRRTGWKTVKLWNTVQRIERGDGNVWKKDIDTLCEAIGTKKHRNYLSLYDRRFYIYIVPKKETPEEKEKRLSGKRVWGNLRRDEDLPEELKEMMMEVEFHRPKASKEELFKKQEKRKEEHEAWEEESVEIHISGGNLNPFGITVN